MRFKELSITPKSLENLLTRTPEGVMSKKLIGQRTIAYIILLWMVVLDLRMEMLSRKYLIIDSTNKVATNRHMTNQYYFMLPLNIFEFPSDMFP